jgi:hypothetical protein
MNAKIFAYVRIGSLRTFFQYPLLGRCVWWSSFRRVGRSVNHRKISLPAWNCTFRRPELALGQGGTSGVVPTGNLLMAGRASVRRLATCGPTVGTGAWRSNKSAFPSMNRYHSFAVARPKPLSSLCFAGAVHYDPRAETTLRIGIERGSGDPQQRCGSENWRSSLLKGAARLRADQEKSNRSEVFGPMKTGTEQSFSPRRGKDPLPSQLPITARSRCGCPGSESGAWAASRVG